MLRSRKDRLTLVTSAPGVLDPGRVVVVAKADAPPPSFGSSATAPQVRLDIEVLDERSTSPIGLVAGLFLLVGATVGLVVGTRRLTETYSRIAVIQAVIPVLAVIVVVMIVMSDSLLPTTF